MVILPIAILAQIYYTIVTVKENTKHRTPKGSNQEAMTKALADMGYDALTYCAID